MGVLEKIRAIEEEVGRTQKNKATEYHLGLLRAKLAKLRTELIEPKSGGGTDAGRSFEVAKYGHARVAFIGFPSVGKSSLLCALTGANSLVAAYEYTTLLSCPGVLRYNDAKIQLVDLPGIIQGAASGVGRGRPVIATAKSADLLLMVLDATKDETQKEKLLGELALCGIRVNQMPPNVSVTRQKGGGIRFNATVNQTHGVNQKMAELICKEYRILNADIVCRDDITVDQLVDVLETNRVYPRCLFVYNKIDLLNINEIDQLARDDPRHTVVISCGDVKLNLALLVRRIWNELGLVRVYTKKQGDYPDLKDPIILTPQRTHGRRCSVEHAAGCLHADILREFKNAYVWGVSAKHSPQLVGGKHFLADEDVIQIQKMTAGERARARHGKKTGTTIAGTCIKAEKKEKEEKKRGPRS